MTTRPIDQEKLKALLLEYGSLAKANDALKKEKAILETEVQHLQELKAEKTQLVQEKAQLETSIRSLAELKTKLANNNEILDRKTKSYEKSVSELKTEVEGLERKKSAIGKEISDREQRRRYLTEELKPLEENLKLKSDLDEKIAEATVRLKSLETRLEGERERFEVFDAFLGLIQAGDWHQLELFSNILPAILKESREKSYSVDILRNHIINRITGKTVNILSCGNCGAAFFCQQAAAIFRLPVPIMPYEHINPHKG